MQKAILKAITILMNQTTTAEKITALIVKQIKIQIDKLNIACGKTTIKSRVLPYFYSCG